MSDLVVEQCDPRDREAELKDLFARNGKPIFAEVFDRTYRLRAEHGLRSWIGLQDGRAVMHISVTPLPFEGCERSLTGGCLADLMVDDSFRDFWAPVRLLRKMISDVKRAGHIGFLLTTTTSEAESVFKAGGFKPFGTLRRYVLPLSRLYLTVSRLRARVRRSRAEQRAFQDWQRSLPFMTESATMWRPRPSIDYYETRMPRYEFTDGKWLSIGNRRDATGGWALVARNLEYNELHLADAFWNNQGIRLGEVVHAAARWGRAQGFKKLSYTTLEEARATAQFEHCGFFKRDVRSALLIHHTGSVAPPGIEDWFFSGFALSGW